MISVTGWLGSYQFGHTGWLRLIEGSASHAEEKLLRLHSHKPLLDASSQV